MNTFDPAREVTVYFEFDTGMLTLKQGVNTFYTDDIALRDVSFVIDEKLRNHMLKTGKRVVHAWCIGIITTVPKPITKDWWTPVRYKPQQDECFHLEEFNGIPVYDAPLVYINNRRAYVPRTTTK